MQISQERTPAGALDGTFPLVQRGNQPVACLPCLPPSTLQPSVYNTAGHAQMSMFCIIKTLVLDKEAGNGRTLQTIAAHYQRGYGGG